MNDYNKKAITDVYKNANIALTSLKAIIPTVKDLDFKKELKDEFNGYDKEIDEIKAFMEKSKLPVKKVNPFKKAMLSLSVKIKTALDNSKNKAAELMVKGTVMGITELYAMKNESEKLSEGVKTRVEKLLSLEESFESRLKKYL